MLIERDLKLLLKQLGESRLYGLTTNVIALGQRVKIIRTKSIGKKALARERCADVQVEDMALIV